ncbi:MAG: hypothetical protein IJK63_01450 [Oscillospiraceae bacterium]|nr:hypothetical protein [Clostridia bacterium]MBQ6272871.1 hypothetical protein [Oscillospiraceae bacterium]
MPQIYEMTIAGHPLRYAFLHPGTRFLLNPLPRRVEGEDCDIAVTPEKIELGRNFLPPDSSDAYVEYRCLIELTARALLPYGGCVFHAAAFAWRDRAWLLTAPPETGKTTQFLNWQRLHPGEITMISGDMPALETREDGSVWVHFSPWNGKENLFSRTSAPLGGLVLLEQGRENRIAPLSPREGVSPLLQQFMALPETEEELYAMAALLERMLRTAPAWKLINLGDDASTELLRETLLAELKERGEA